MRRTTVLAVSALLLAGCGGHSASPTAGPSTPPSTSPATSTAGRGTGVVPWRPLPPTRPSIPFTVTPPRPNPLRAEQARRCTGSDLDVRFQGEGAAAGTMGENVVVGLAPGHSPCAVSGRPQVVAHTVEGTTVPGILSMWIGRGHGPVRLTPHQHALVQLTWPSACYTRSPGTASFVLGYGGRTWTHPVPDLSDTCHFEPDRPLGAVGVSRFIPGSYRGAHRVTAYNGVRMRIPRQLTLRYDEPVDFLVTLVSRRRLVLDPCPDYRIGDGLGEARYQLNCAAVPWHDAMGRPYLPAGRPVRFAMKLGGVAGRAAKFWWGVVAPGRPPFEVGLIRVRSPGQVSPG